MRWKYVLICGSMATAIVMGTLILAHPLQDKPATADAGLAEPYIYVQSDITKANPIIRADEGYASWTSLTISDVADDVKYTIQGTILEIRDPIDWYEQDDGASGHGTIPVVMSVETVHKGSFDSYTIMFFLGSYLIHPETFSGDSVTVADVADSPKEYHLFPFEPQFVVGDRVLVHLSEIDLRFDSMTIDPEDVDLLTPYYGVVLGKHGAYHVHGDRIYNTVIPDGAPISLAIHESRALD